MSPPSTLIDVEVPASLSNMGPGLDTLGMSIDLYNRFRFFPLPPGRFEHCLLYTSPSPRD